MGTHFFEFFLVLLQTLTLRRAPFLLGLQGLGFGLQFALGSEEGRRFLLLFRFVDQAAFAFVDLGEGVFLDSVELN